MTITIWYGMVMGIPGFKNFKATCSPVVSSCAVFTLYQQMNGEYVYMSVWSRSAKKKKKAKQFTWRSHPNLNHRESINQSYMNIYIDYSVYDTVYGTVVWYGNGNGRVMMMVI